jgi:predicted ribosome quality control (RQC) complex YloA/Tae2 family protein
LLSKSASLAKIVAVHQQTIKTIVAEAGQMVTGRFLGKIFQLSSFSVALDFGLRDGSYLLLSVEPKKPRIHLIKRRVRELEKESLPLGPFAQTMRSSLDSAEVVSLNVHSSERIVRLLFSKQDETGASHSITLLAQLTGRSANLFLLDSNDVITHAFRSPKGEGQQLGQHYQPPATQAKRGAEEEILERAEFPSLSAAADDYFTRLEAAENFAARVQAVRDRLRRQIAQREKLEVNLSKDLTTHGDAEQHKRRGDLLLANIATAERIGAMVRLKDYYAEGEPLIEIEVDENRSLQEEAAYYFSRYTKSKRAKEEIATRLRQIDRDLKDLREKQALVEDIFISQDETAFAGLEEGKSQAASPRTKRDRIEKLPGVRRYRSSDGYEILVGRAAHTNDQLTFKVAKPHDVWLHAADYPGSHVIVRNTSRNEIPHRTILEAAQLAAKFSQAGQDSKVNVNYSQRKFLSKPKGAAPGLVRMSSFRTVTVAPGENVERI